MRGHIRKRGNRSWTLVFDIGHDDLGRRRQKWETVRGTRKQAEARLNAIMNEVETGSFVEPARITVSDYLLQRWLTHVRTRVTPKTAERYEEIVRLHLIPAIGHRRLSLLRALHIQDYYDRAL